MILLRDKPTKMLISILYKPKSVTNIAKETDTTYSHTSNILIKFDDLGLVRKKAHKKCKRTVIVSLTPFGKEVAKKLLDIKLFMKGR